LASPAEPQSVANQLDQIAHAVFGLLFQVSAEAVLIVDRSSNRVVSANPRAAELLRREPEALIGLTIADISFDPNRELCQPGHYEEVVLRRGDDYPTYTEVQVTDVHVPDHGDFAAYTMRDTAERRLLERELVAKHSALFRAHAELEHAHRQLSETKSELETRNREIATLAWRAAMGELVARIAHHLNNPIGALASTIRRLDLLVGRIEVQDRQELERLQRRIAQIARRIEANISAIVQATAYPAGSGEYPRIPPELATELSSLDEHLEDIPLKESP
jgi:signal transduction histidine kinase